jgi:hypothetical protein
MVITFKERYLKPKLFYLQNERKSHFFLQHKQELTKEQKRRNFDEKKAHMPIEIDNQIVAV